MAPKIRFTKGTSSWSVAKAVKKVERCQASRRFRGCFQNELMRSSLKAACFKLFVDHKQQITKLIVDTVVHAKTQLVAYVNYLAYGEHPSRHLFETLPFELLKMIFESLSLNDLKRVACCSWYLSKALQMYYMSTAFRQRFDIFAIAQFGTFLVNTFLNYRRY